MSRRHSFRVASITAVLALSGCALTGKSEALTVRFFTPEPLVGRFDASKRAPTQPSELRIGRISAAADLKENIAFRDGTHEVGYYDDRLWTERPDAFLGRALHRVLFEERGLRHVISGASPTLDVRLLSFEEIRAAPRRVRVQVSIVLHDERIVRVEETVTVERRLLAGAGPANAEELARVLGEALAALVGEIADRVEKGLQPGAAAGSRDPR